MSGDTHHIPQSTSPGPGEPAGADAAVAATVPVPGRRPGGSRSQAAQPDDPDVAATDGGTAPAARGGSQRTTTSAGARDQPRAMDTDRPGPRAHHLTAIVERTAAGPVYYATPVAPAVHSGPPVGRSGASPPSISVTIGRVDVVAVVETTPPPALRPPSRPPAPSLEEYLRERSGRSR
jgi:hypothetical protein